MMHNLIPVAKDCTDEEMMTFFQAITDHLSVHNRSGTVYEAKKFQQEIWLISALKNLQVHLLV